MMEEMGAKETKPVAEGVAQCDLDTLLTILVETNDIREKLTQTRWLAGRDGYGSESELCSVLKEASRKAKQHSAALEAAIAKAGYTPLRAPGALDSTLLGRKRNLVASEKCSSVPPRK